MQMVLIIPTQSLSLSLSLTHTHTTQRCECGRSLNIAKEDWKCRERGVVEENFTFEVIVLNLKTSTQY